LVRSNGLNKGFLTFGKSASLQRQPFHHSIPGHSSQSYLSRNSRSASVRKCSPLDTIGLPRNAQVCHRACHLKLQTPVLDSADQSDQIDLSASREAVTFSSFVLVSSTVLCISECVTVLGRDTAPIASRASFAQLASSWPGIRDFLSLALTTNHSN